VVKEWYLSKEARAKQSKKIKVECERKNDSVRKKK